MNVNDSRDDIHPSCTASSSDIEWRYNVDDKPPFFVAEVANKRYKYRKGK